MRILRIQNRMGYGPYFTNRDKKATAICRMQDEHNKRYTTSIHPPTHLDKGIFRSMKSKERCGFLNEGQLHNWFSNEELEMLEENGFPLVEAEGNITAIGTHQVLFIPIEQLN